MPKPIRQLDRFAEALAQSAGTDYDGNVAAVARRLGYPADYGNAQLQRIRRELGDQAR